MALPVQILFTKSKQLKSIVSWTACVSHYHYRNPISSLWKKTTTTTTTPSQRRKLLPLRGRKNKNKTKTHHCFTKQNPTDLPEAFLALGLFVGMMEIYSKYFSVLFQLFHLCCYFHHIAREIMEISNFVFLVLCSKYCSQDIFFLLYLERRGRR